MATSPQKKAKSKKSKPAGPTTLSLVVKAIAGMKDPKGSSGTAIKKYIASTGVNRDNSFVNKALKRGVTTGVLKQVKGTGASGSFKLDTAKAKAAEMAKAKRAKMATRKKAAAAKKRVAAAKKRAAAAKRKAAAAKRKAAGKKKKAAKKTKKSAKKTAKQSKPKKAGKPKKKAAKRPAKKTAKKPVKKDARKKKPVKK